MPLTLRTSGQCAFCVFRASEWAPSRCKPVQKLQGARPYSKIRRLPQRKPPTVNKGSRSVNLVSPRPLPRPVIRGGRPIPRSALRVPQEQAAGGNYHLFSKEETTYAVFGKLLAEQVSNLRRKLNRDQVAVAAWGITSTDDLEKELASFEESIEQCIQKAESGVIGKADNPLFYRLRQAFVLGNVKELAAEMKYAFINHVVSANFTTQDKTNQEKLADLRYPVEWYPATRAMQRTVHLHVGPTNSGKTYHALQRLEAAETGIYAGPLRLLAHEVYSRFNAKGKACALVTGEERRVPEGMRKLMSSCTVEMVPLNAVMDVAVIDEIQMMADPERGWAWTQAFLGVQAKEVHLCGELRTIELVTDLCKTMGDELVIHRYERLSPLKTEARSLGGNLNRLQKGDAIILFSRVAIHAMKADVEKTTGRRCAVVYGSLPPETRAQQAALFNDPDNDYDFLVASDAVGMGLNLSIKRIIFEATSKHDGIGFRLIQTSEIKQIAGRAGRYKTASDAMKNDSEDAEETSGELVEEKKKPVKNMGLVTTLESFDLPIVKRAMETEVEPLKTAGIFPPSNILLRFANYFPAKTPFSYIVLRLHEISSLHSNFHLCRLKEQIEVADLIQPYSLTNMDRIVFMSAPVAIREPGFADVITEFADCVAKQTGGELVDLKSVNLELLDMDIHDHPNNGSKGYLKEAEALHKALTLYLWLSYRFVGIFRSQALAFHVKALVEEKIDQCLAEVHWDANRRRQLTKLRQKAVEDQVVEREAAFEIGEDPEATLERQTPRERDGSDANEAFEDQATDMDIPEENADGERLSETPILPLSEESKYDSANV